MLQIPGLASLKLYIKAKNDLPKLTPVLLFLPDKPVEEAMMCIRLLTQN
jgi:hypothetical protein